MQLEFLSQWAECGRRVGFRRYTVYIFSGCRAFVACAEKAQVDALFADAVGLSQKDGDGQNKFFSAVRIEGCAWVP